MKRFTQSLYHDMQSKLQGLEQGSTNVITLSLQSLHLVQSCLQQLKTFITAYEFPDPAEEILFFKEIKPLFLSEYWFQKERLRIETGKPVGDSKAGIKYYRQAIDEINQYIDRNQEFYRYHLCGRTDKDALYFLRKNRSQTDTDYHWDMDEQFTTYHSSKLAKLQGMERLADYVAYAIRNLQGGFSHKDAVEDIAIPWTDKKTGLVELLYGFQCIGALNHSKVELKQIARLLEVAFRVDLGNYARTFQEIRIRKKDRTAFIDRMRDMLLKRMDEADEY